jgi:Kelch motif
MTPHRRLSGTPQRGARAALWALSASALAACVSTSAPSTDTGVDLDKAAVAISQSATANGPFPAAGPGGTVGVFWSQNDNQVRRRVSVDGGLTFSTEEVILDAGPLGNVTAGQQQPRPMSAVMDDAGHTHLLLQVSDPADATRSDIYYADVERYALPVEKALVAGGRNLSGQGQLAVVAYDPRTQQWEPVGRAALGSGLLCAAGAPAAADAGRRWDHAAAAFGGRVYVTGGSDLTGPLATVQYLDPARRTWLTEASLPGPRTGHALVSDGTYLYAVGGGDAAAALGSIARLDPAAGTGYTFGGDGTIAACTEPATSPWVTLAAGLGVGRVHLDAVVVERASGARDLYVIGGETFSGTPLTNVDAFRIDPGGVLTPLLPPLPPLPAPRSHHRAVAVGERIYVLGGTSDGTDVRDDALVLDLAAASPAWLSVPKMPAPRRDFTASVLMGKVYVMSGRDDLGPTAAVDVLDPATETWEREPESTAPVLSMGAAAAVFSEPSLPRNLSRQSANATQPELVRDPASGDLYAVWRNEAPVAVAEGEAPRTTADVYLRRSMDGGVTFAETPVRLSALGVLSTHNNNFSGNPRVAVGPNGVVHVTWIETGEVGTFDQGGQELIYTNCAPDDLGETGLDCGADVLAFAAVGGTGADTPPAGQMKTPAIAVDAAGEVYLAWIDADGTVPTATASANRVFALNVYFTWRRTTGTFADPVAVGTDLTGRMDELFPTGSVTDPVAEVAKLATRVNTPTLVTDQAGEVNVLWANDSEVRLRRSKDGGRSFLIEVGVAPLVSGAQRQGPGMVYDPVADRLVALWQTLTASGLPAPNDIDSVLETRAVQPR